MINKEQLKQIFEKQGLLNVWEEIEPKLRNSISVSLVSVAKEDDISKGQSKMGGVPDLPKDVAWFTNPQGVPMSFLAQINLAETAQYDVENRLPKTGILYFFYDIDESRWGFDPKDIGYSKVYYFAGDINDLQRTKLPESLTSDYVLKPCALKFDSSIDYPDSGSWQMKDVELNDEQYDAYWDLSDLLHPSGIINKLLGHSNNLQGDMELECELVTNGLYCGNQTGYKDPRRKELEPNANLWHLLLQIDSNDENEVMWGDSGRLYFWIRSNDLEALNFENAWLIQQCL